MEKLWASLERKIEERFQIADPEWVQVEISKNSKIHVTIVADHRIEKDDVRNLIQKEMKEQREVYTIGFVDIYSLDEAEELAVIRSQNVGKVCTWADGLNVDEQEEPDFPGMNVISFYSYKGGVGRTVALIQTAYNLARAGKRKRRNS